MMKIAHEHEEVANFMADMFECESGGLYRGRDGREPLEITLRLSLPVRKMLSLGLSNDDGEVSPAILDNGFI